MPKRTATRDPDEGLVVQTIDGYKPPFAEPTGAEWFDWRKVLVMDTEANGLLDVDDYHFHCAWTFDPMTGTYRGYDARKGADQMARFADALSSRQVVAHNGLGYDYQAIKKVFPGWGCELEIDTLVLVKMLWSADELIDKDAKLWRTGRMPGEQMKRQGIEAWGYRLGQMKGDYSKQKKAEFIADGGNPRDYEAMMRFTWGEPNDDMFWYNKQDVVVNESIFELVCRKLNWFQQPSPEAASRSIYTWPSLPIETEHLMQEICLKQELHGLPMDLTKAIELGDRLLKQRDEIEGKVAAIFKPWFQPKGDTSTGTLIPSTRHVKRTDLPDVTIARMSKAGKALKPYVGPPSAWYEEGCYHVPIVFTEFNLRNRHHLANRLMAVYGWRPLAWGGSKGTDPVIDEVTLRGISDSVLEPKLKELILAYYVIDKTYSTLAGGTKAWLTLRDEVTGSVHGRTDPLGTVTHRGSHSNPNLGNIPSVDLDEVKDPKTGKVLHKDPIRGLEGSFGYECREMFGPLPIFGYQTGTDMYALELFMLAHFLAPYDGGAMIRRLESGIDIHAQHAEMIGLPRKPTKTTTYATIYGSGGLGIGEQVWEDGVDDERDWSEANGVKGWLNYLRRREGDSFKMPSLLVRAQYGKGMFTKSKLLKGIPGLEDLIKDVIDAAKETHQLRLLDGRKIFVRKEFAALNSLLQANGAIACKLWIVAMHRLMEKLGYRESVLEIGTGRVLEANDWNQIAWVHDETQNEHREGLGSVIAEVSSQAAAIASKQLGLRTTLTTDSKTGHNWAECH